jgi:hypothetical protein
MLPLNPFFLVPAAKIAALQATVLFLIICLLKAKIQIKVASTIGILLLFLQTTIFLIVLAGGAYALKKQRN